MNQINVSNTRQISIGILTWKSKITLLRTLLSLKEASIFDTFEDILILCNEYENSNLSFISESIFSKIILHRENIGIGPAIRELIFHSKYHHFLFLEDDFFALNPIDCLSKIICASNLVDQTKIEYVKLRNNYHPGEPCYSYNFIGKERTHENGSLLTDSIYWYGRKAPLAHPQIRLLSGQKWEYIFSSCKYSNYTNNPALYTKDFYYTYIDPYLGTGVDIEGLIAQPWREGSHLVAHQIDGPFSHLRIDR